MEYLETLIYSRFILRGCRPDSFCLCQSNIFVVVALDEEESGTIEDVLQLGSLVYNRKYKYYSMK